MAPGNEPTSVQEITEDDKNTTTYYPPSKDDIKRVRLSEYRQDIEREMQAILVVAAELRKLISEAKTAPKRVYYQKKFKKVQNKLLQLLSMLQKINSLAPSDPAPETTQEGANLNLTPTIQEATNAQPAI